MLLMKESMLSLKEKQYIISIPNYVTLHQSRMAIIITFISISESPMDYIIEKYQITKEELREAMYGLYGPVPSVSSGNSIISVTIHQCC